MSDYDENKMEKDLDEGMKNISSDMIKDILKLNSKQIIETIGESKNFAQDILRRAENMGMSVDEVVIALADILRAIATIGSPQRYVAVYCALKDLQSLLPIIETKDARKKKARELYDKFFEIAVDKCTVADLDKILREEIEKMKGSGKKYE